MRLGHTQDSLKLYEFLEKYPNQWHTYKTDKRTVKAVERVKFLHGLEILRMGKTWMMNLKTEDK